MDDTPLYGTGRVFLPHVHERFDHAVGRRVPAFDFSDAAKHGPLVRVLDPEDDPLFLGSLVTKIRHRLSDFDAANDFMVPVGDPAVIAACTGIILRDSRILRMLKWDKKAAEYTKVIIQL